MMPTMGVQWLDTWKISRKCPAELPLLDNDERVRFCAQCGQNVYNLSAMTRVDAEALLRLREGKICTSFYRRADGSIVTSDCSVDLVKVRWRAPRAASIAAGALLAVGMAFAAPVSGVVKDAAGTALEGATVTLVHRKSGKKVETRTDSQGRFLVVQVDEGSYRLEFASPGFAKLAKELTVRKTKSPEIEATLLVGSVGGPEEISLRKD
jgi:hypothetical protein